MGHGIIVEKMCARLSGKGRNKESPAQILIRMGQKMHKGIIRVLPRLHGQQIIHSQL